MARRRGHTEEQILATLRQAESGTTVADLTLRFEAPSVRADGRARLDGGTLELEDLTIQAYGGSGRGEVDARLDERGRPFRMRAEADGVQTEIGRAHV